MTISSLPPLAFGGALAQAFVSMLPSIRKAAEALEREADRAPDAEPFKGTLLKACTGLGRPRDPGPLLSFWESRLPGHPRSDSRYRWEISHRLGVSEPPYAERVGTWRTWRQGEQARFERDPFGFETRLILPMVCTDNAELLAELAEGEGNQARRARQLLQETAHVLRRDFAVHVQMNDAWEDTFALFCLTRRPRVLSILHPIAVAIAACHAADNHGPIAGTKYPYAGQPLVSASAQLASSLLMLGSELEFVATLAAFVRDARRDSGAFGDASEADDPLTTLVAVDLLSQVDPSFDATATLDYFAGAQRPDGLWHALGPDAPWLTSEILAWSVNSRQPFAARFRWPHRAQLLRDHKTGLPFFAYFIELADLFATMPGLASADAELAFIDLIGFRTFNNRFGQQAGDDVLRLFASELEQLPFARAIRDGGDEFLIVGAPYRPSLFGDLDVFRKRWPVRFRRRFGAEVPPVAPRMIVRRGEGRGLRALRERLGQEIGALKERSTACGDEGLLVDAGSADGVLGA